MKAARARLEHELSLSRRMLTKHMDAAPRFILELPHFKHMVILTNLPASGFKRDMALRLIANILAYKTALSFVFALQTLRPDTFYSMVVSPNLHLGALQMFDRNSMHFDEVMFFDPQHTDRDIIDLFPTGHMTLRYEDELEIRNFLEQNEAWPNTFILEV